MDILSGLALFGAGVVAGGYLMTSFYNTLSGVQEHERRVAARDMDMARRYNEAMRAELDANARSLRRMEDKQAVETSWCDGYEAGLREGMQGVKMGDVIALVRLRRARMNKAE